MPDLVPPPGEAVVWHDGTTLWAATHVGVERVADADSVSRLWMAPSGRHVAYRVSGEDGWELWIAGLPVANGAPARKLLDRSALSHVAPVALWGVAQWGTATARVEPWHVAWAPDDGAIAFTLADTWPHPFGFAERDDLWWLDAAGGPPWELLGPGRGGAAVFSPDGSRLAVNGQFDWSDEGKLVRRSQSVVAVLDVAAALAGEAEPEVLQLAAPFGSESDWTVYHGLQWAPGGEAVYMAIGTDVGPEEDYPWAGLDSRVDLVRIGLDGTRTVVVAAGDSSVRWDQFPNGAWSPDGSRLAWLAPRPTATPASVQYPPPPAGTPAPPPADDTHGERDLLIANWDGTAAASALRVSYARMLWSPDSSSLAIQPSWPDIMGTRRFGAWRLARAGEEIAVRDDLSPDVMAWVGPDLFLVAERPPSDERDSDGRDVRLLLVALDGRWRELAPRAEMWETRPVVGVLGE